MDSPRERETKWGQSYGRNVLGERESESKRAREHTREGDGGVLAL